MLCPFCPVEETPRGLHAHLASTHGDEVVFEEKGERAFYSVTCPVCGDGYSHEIKPRGRDPEFVNEFRTHIALVAFDMLVNHLLVEHDPEAAAPDDSEPADEEGRPGAVGGRTGPAWLIEARRRAADDQAQPGP